MPSANGRGASGATASRIRCWASWSEITGPRELREASPTGELADPFGERGTEIGAVERQFDVGSEIVEFLADVVAAAVTSQPEHLLLTEDQRDRVGELEFAAGAGFDAIERIEDRGGEHVPADHRKVRRRHRRVPVSPRSGGW